MGFTHPDGIIWAFLAVTKCLFTRANRQRCHRRSGLHPVNGHLAFENWLHFSVSSSLTALQKTWECESSSLVTEIRLSAVVSLLDPHLFIAALRGSPGGLFPHTVIVCGGEKGSA